MTAISSHPAHPRVSVIVPVYNDRDVLSTCLEALAHQTFPACDFEVLVVDNGSTEPLGDLPARFPEVRFESEPKPGSYAARNRGILCSRGEMIAFTDADCIPRADWIERGVAQLEATPALGLLGGAVNVFPRDPLHMTPTEIYEKGCAIMQDVYIGRFKFAATANVFTFRKVLDDVGWFDAELKSGGDWEWGTRVSAKYPMAFGNDVVVSHPARHTFRERARKARRIAAGLYGMTQRRSSAGHARTFARELLINQPRGLLLFGRLLLMTPRLDSPRERVIALAVEIGIRTVICAEICRIEFGGTPLRR